MFDHTVLAQGFTDPSSVLYTYGPLGVLFKQFEVTLALERERTKRAEDELRVLNASIRDQYVPALERATGVIAQTLRTSRRDDFHDDATR